MPTVSKEEFYEEMRLENEKRAKWLAEAKADAAVRGKEPFDLTKLEEMCDTSSEGRVDAEDVRYARFEFIYYVQQPQLMTLKELADYVSRAES